MCIEIRSVVLKPISYLTLILVQLSLAHFSYAQEPDIYWAGAAKAGETRQAAIFRYNPGIGEVDTLLHMSTLSPNEARYVFRMNVDTLNGHVYWTDSGGRNADGEFELGAMGKMSLDGLDPTVLLSPLSGPMCPPNDIEFDHDGGKLYWGSSCSGSGLHVIAMGELETSRGQNLPTLPMRANYSVSAIEVDVPGNMIYWVNKDFFTIEPDGIVRAPLTDTVMDEYIVMGSVCDIALARGIEKLYWTTCASGRIQRSDMDGSGVEEVLVSENEIGRLAVDDDGGKIYWTETAAGIIRRANLDGSDVEDVLTGLSVPGSIAVVSGSEVHTGSESGAAFPEEEAFRDRAGLAVSVYPNPIRSAAHVELTLAAPGRVTLELFDPLGRRVASRESRVRPAGTTRIEWNTAHVPGGIYFLRAVTASGSFTVPVVLRR